MAPAWREDDAGIRQAIEQNEWSDVNGEIARVAKALEDEAALVEGGGRVFKDT